MPAILFTGGTLVLPDRLEKSGTLLCKDGRILEIKSDVVSSDSVSANNQTVDPTHLSEPNQEVEPQQETDQEVRVVDLQGGYLCPGFVDIHVHGGAGADFMDGTTEAVFTASQAHLAHGTTTLFPTTSTGTVKQIHRMIDACQSLMQDSTEPCANSSEPCAKIGGIHLYGPYFSPDKAGCHLSEQCRDPREEEYEAYFDSGVIRIATCAAELPGSEHFYQFANQHNCLITCGHSNASWTQMQRAFDQGMRHVDHFWCAMSNVSSVRKEHGFPMQGSMLEFVLAQSEMSTEVIADGQHLSPELLRFAWQMKTSKKLCLVTDCNRALDMPPGRYRFGSREDGAWFESNGKVGLASPDALASSIRGMDFMVRTLLKQTDIPMVDVIRMATLTPAELVGEDQTIGSLEIGKQADLVQLNADHEVVSVFIEGVEYPANEASK